MVWAKSRELVGRFAEMVIQVREPSVIWPLMLKELQSAIGFDAGYIGATWSDAGEGRGAVAEHDPAFIKANLSRFLAEIHPQEVALYTDHARVHHDVWPPSRQRELAVFRELLEPSGMKHMIVRASVSQGNLAGINLERRSDTPFSERDLQLVDIVAPFLHIVEVLTLCSHDDCVADAFAEEHSLTDREASLVSLVAKGLQNSEIAALMGVSSNTVRNSLVRVFEKVGVSNRAELAYVTFRPRARLQGAHVRSNRKSKDGLEAFRARVAQAACAMTATDAVEAPALGARIVYIAPVPMITTPASAGTSVL